MFGAYWTFLGLTVAMLLGPAYLRVYQFCIVVFRLLGMVVRNAVTWWFGG